MEQVTRKITLERVVWPGSAGQPLCMACRLRITEGQSACRRLLGPGANTEAREKCLAGQPYEAEFCWLHWACATGDRDGSIDQVSGDQPIERGRLGQDHDPIRCQACSSMIAPGFSYTMIPMGPGDDPEAQHKALRGAPHNAVAAVLHWACATGDNAPERTTCTECDAPLGADKVCHNRGACTLAVPG